MDELEKQMSEHILQNKFFQENMRADFSEHIRVYRENGKDMARLAQAVEDLKQVIEAHIQRTEPMIEIYEGLTISRKFILGIVGFAASIIGLFILIKQLLK